MVVKGSKLAWNETWKTMVRELAPQDKRGNYQRPKSGFTSDKWKRGRPRLDVSETKYVLYVGNACPWCHRVSLAVVLLGLENCVELVELTDDAERASRGGWVFDARDPVYGSRDLRELYDRLSPGGFIGRCTAPLLVHRRDKSIVSNFSPDICRFLNSLTAGTNNINLFPQKLDGELERLAEDVYSNINNAVYRAGFSTSQGAYSSAISDLYGGLDRMESILETNDFLLGDKVTAVDLYLLPTVLRFDAIYSTLFKCCGRRVVDFPSLHRWMRVLFSVEGVEGTFDLESARKSYYTQLFPLNPSLIIPTRPSMLDVLQGPKNEREFSPPNIRDVAWTRTL